MKILATTVALLCILLAESRPAAALPVFAHRFDLTCGVCHTVVPHLSPFGQAFLRAGFRLPAGMTRHAAVPIALKMNLAYSSAQDPAGLPKAIVDEVELLAGDAIGSRLSYRIEQYVVDGGTPGRTRDAWIAYTSRPTFGDQHPSLRVTAGEFTLPLTVDPETQRDTEAHYSIFDQTVGANPFDLFDDRIGVDAAFGRSAGGGTDVHLLALRGHDPGAGLPTLGTDTMIFAQSGAPDLVFSAYRYDGARPLGPIDDRFWRQGFGAVGLVGKAEFDGLIGTGTDRSADGLGTHAASSAGFLQTRWAFSPKMFAVARADWSDDTLAGRRTSVTASIVVRPAPNARLTIEDFVQRGRHVLNAGLLFAY